MSKVCARSSDDRLRNPARLIHHKTSACLVISGKNNRALVTPVPLLQQQYKCMNCASNSTPVTFDSYRKECCPLFSLRCTVLLTKGQKVPVMLRKCHNSQCFEPFRYLEGGKLFLLQADPKVDACGSTRIEYFWLCTGCSATMTLALGEDDAPNVIQLREPPVNMDAPGTGRKRGLLLQTINSLLLKPVPKRGNNFETAARISEARQAERYFGHW